MVGKGKSQPRSSPEIPRPGTEQLRLLGNPLEGIPAVDFGNGKPDEQMIKDRLCRTRPSTGHSKLMTNEAFITFVT